MYYICERRHALKFLSCKFQIECFHKYYLENQNIKKMKHIPFMLPFMIRKTVYNVTLLHKCFPVNLLHICRMTFTKSTSGVMLLLITECVINGIQIKHTYMK